MGLELVPRALAGALSAGAVAIAWLVGLVCDVPIRSVTLRSMAGALLFWALGLLIGKVFVRIAQVGTREPPLGSASEMESAVPTDPLALRNDQATQPLRVGSYS